MQNKFNSKINKIIDLTYKFSEIERDMFYPNFERQENDSEHTFQLALVAWYIMQKDNLPLNKEKVFKLCLAHDLVEIHSGDVPLWGSVGHNEKNEKEKAAVEKIKSDFPESPEIVSSILEYKAKDTEEGKFVNALDKLIPFLNQLNTAGIIWKKYAVNLDQVLEKLEKHSDISKYLKKYFEEGIEHLRKNEDFYLS